MKRVILFLALGCIVLAPQMAAGEEEYVNCSMDNAMPQITRDDKKAAAAWFKEDLANKKKALSLFKKIKDEKSARKSVQAALKLYGLTHEGEQTALGEVGERRVPRGPAMEAEAKKTEKARRRLQEMILKEQERIEGMVIEDSNLIIDLTRAFEAAKQ